MGGGKSSGGGGGGYVGRRYDSSGKFAEGSGPTKGQRPAVAGEGGGESADKGFSTGSSGKGAPGSTGYSGKELSQIGKTAGVAGLTTAATGYGIPLSAMAALAGAGYEAHQINKAHEREFQGLNKAPPGTPTISAMGQKRSFSTPSAISGLLDDEGSGSGVGGFDAGGYTESDAASARGGRL